MATLKAVVDHRKADGTYCVKIRITHNRKSLYISTSLYVTDRQLTKSKKIKDHNVIMASNRLIDEMRSIIVTIEGLDYMDCDRLRRIVTAKMAQGKDFRLDFYEYAERKIAKKSFNNAKVAKTVLAHLMAFAPTLDVNNITYKFIISFREYMESKGISNNSINIYLSKIRHLIHLAKDDYNDDDTVNVRVNPFKKDVIPSMEATRHNVLTAEQVRNLLHIKGDRNENFARDVFMLSFCLIGINMVDLFSLKKSDVEDGLLTYNRQKTKTVRADKAKITIRIEPEAQELIDRYSTSCDDYLLSLHNRYSDSRSASMSINTFLKRLKLYDSTLPSDLFYYYARHSWATIAYNDCGIDLQTIHEALNHASSREMKITDVYVKKDFTRIWAANRKVLDYIYKNSSTGEAEEKRMSVHKI